MLQEYYHFSHIVAGGCTFSVSLRTRNMSTVYQRKVLGALQHLFLYVLQGAGIRHLSPKQFRQRLLRIFQNKPLSLQIATINDLSKLRMASNLSRHGRADLLPIAFEFGLTLTTPPTPERNIYMGNLDPNVRTSDITHYLSHCGDITRLRLTNSKERSTGYAYIEFKEGEAAKRAQKLNGQIFFGKQIQISPASDNFKLQSLYGTNLF